METCGGGSPSRRRPSRAKPSAGGLWWASSSSPRLLHRRPPRCSTSSEPADVADQRRPSTCRRRSLVSSLNASTSQQLHGERGRRRRDAQSGTIYARSRRHRWGAPHRRGPDPTFAAGYRPLRAIRRPSPLFRRRGMRRAPGSHHHDRHGRRRRKPSAASRARRADDRRVSADCHHSAQSRHKTGCVDQVLPLGRYRGDSEITRVVAFHSRAVGLRVLLLGRRPFGVFL